MEALIHPSLYPRADDRRLYSWYNITAPYNGTAVEGEKSLDFSDFFFQQIVANNIAVAALTLYIWEYFSTLYDEFHLYKYHKLLSRHVILFIMVRYGSLPSLILPAFSVWHDFSMDGDKCLRHQQLAICVTQLIVSIVFAWRTVAIWDYKRKITIFFVVIVFVQFGISFGLLWFQEEKLLPNGACMPVTPENGFNPLPVFYAIAFAYEFITIGMATFKLWQISMIGRAEETSEHWTRLITSPTLFWKQVKSQWRAMSASPLVHRLLQSGLVYLFIASAYNAVSFALEVRKDIHAKSLIMLYAPLMCVLCQRVILLDVKAIWGGINKSSDGSNEKNLIDRVMQERRLSWEGSNVDPTESPRGLLNESNGREEDSGHHIAIDINRSTSSPMQGGVFDFQDMLNQSPPYKKSRRERWKSLGRKDRSEGGDITSNPSSFTSTSSKQSPTKVASSMSEDNKALALKMAGLEPPYSPSSEEGTSRREN